MTRKTGGRREGGEEERRGGEEKTTHIKSNNPHLTGGEKHCTLQDIQKSPEEIEGETWKARSPDKEFISATKSAPQCPTIPMWKQDLQQRNPMSYDCGR